MRPHFKPIPNNESRLFQTILQGNEKEFEYPWHYHPEFELTYILKSRGVRYVGNSIENFFHDDLVLLGSNVPHCWINTPSEEDTANAIVIYLKKEFLDVNWMQSYEFEAINNLLTLSNKGIHFGKSVALRVKDKCFELLKLPPLEKLIMLLEILQELSKTSDYELLCEQGFSYQLNHGHNERINQVYKYIEKNHQNKITLAGIASELNMSEEYFSRYFSKVMKKSFFRFLNEYKINKACKLLIETDKQISEICYAAGFESLPFFYRQFKKLKSSQPKQYRQNYQKALL